MTIFRLVYSSRVARKVRFADAQLIAADSAKRNAQVELTGLLLYSPSHFIQVLEGDETEVRATLERIRGDDRHTALHVLDERHMSQREFGKWAMLARVLPTRLELDLDRLDAAAALSLLRER